MLKHVSVFQSTSKKFIRRNNCCTGMRCKQYFILKSCIKKEQTHIRILIKIMATLPQVRKKFHKVHLLTISKFYSAPIASLLLQKLGYG